MTVDREVVDLQAVETRKSIAARLPALTGPRGGLSVQAILAKRLDWTLAGLAVVLISTLLTRLVYPHLLADLTPWPDAVEYAEGAANIMQHGRLAIWLNGALFPSRYSLGLPLLILPVYWLVGVRYTYAIFSVLVMDLLLVGLTYVLGRRLFGTTAGLLAACIVALSSLDTSASRQIMSDVPATTILVASIVALTYVRSTDKPRRQSHAVASRRNALISSVGGCFLGYAVWIRQVDAAYVPSLGLFLALALWNPRATWRNNLRRLLVPIAWFAGWIVAFEMVLLLYNQATFGNVLRTGYSFWAPGRYDDLRQTFGLEYAIGPTGRAMTYLEALLGWPEAVSEGGPPNVSLYSPLIALLAGLGLLVTCATAFAITPGRLRRTLAGSVEGDASKRLHQQRRFAILAVLVVLTTVAMYDVYFFYSLRFLHVAVPMVAVLASRGGTWLLSQTEGTIDRALRRPAPLRSVARVAIATLIVFQLAADVTNAPWWQTTVLRRDLNTASAFAGMQLVAEHTEPDAVVVDDVSPQLFGAYQTSSQRQLLFLNRQFFLPQPLPRLSQTPDLLFELIARGARVYFVGHPADLVSLYPDGRVGLQPVAWTREAADTVTLYSITVNSYAQPD